MLPLSAALSNFQTLPLPIKTFAFGSGTILNVLSPFEFPLLRYSDKHHNPLVGGAN